MSASSPVSESVRDGDFGGLLRAWRWARGQSQLALSLRSTVSSRHLSYLETGRARPSREMVLRLAQALDIPLRDRNALLQAAGFAAIYRETPLEAPSLGPVRDAIQLLLGATEPNPAFVVNRRYDVLGANPTARWILATFTEDLARFRQPYNFGRLLVCPGGMRPYVENWEEVAGKVLGRLDRELGGAHSRDAAEKALVEEVLPTLSELRNPAGQPEVPPFLVGVRLHRDAIRLNLFTAITTLGTPLDVTLQELRLEALFPAEAESRRVLVSRASASAP